MSYPKSRQAPTFAEHADALRSALVEVAENSFFAFAVPTDADQFADLVRNPVSFDPEQPPAPTRWMKTTVRFAGAFAGQVEVVMGDGLARQLLAAFCGLAPEDELQETQVTDTAGEFGNQVCGTWLTRACQRRRFDLQPPLVEWQAPDWQPLDAPIANEHDGDVLVCLNDHPVRLRVHFDD